MNFMSQARRLELACQEEARDDREDWEKVRDAVLNVIAKQSDVDRVLANCASFIGDERASRAFARAEDALETARSDLACELETHLCVTLDQMRKAVNS